MFGQGSRTGGLKSINVVRQDRNGSTTLWKVLRLVDDNWHFGQVQLPQGEYHLLFQVNGAEYRAGLGHLKLKPGLCDDQHGNSLLYLF